jgi:polygalacturonase
MSNSIEKLVAIQEHLSVPGNKVMVATHLKATVYSAAHVSMFRANADGLFVQRGRYWDCIDYCAIKFGKAAH